MEAPEKIFLYPYSTDGIYEVETKPLEGTVEYTRTDAFIEKACEWLDPVLKNYAGYYVGKDILEGFKNYMKGE